MIFPPFDSKISGSLFLNDKTMNVFQQIASEVLLKKELKKTYVIEAIKVM